MKENNCGLTNNFKVKVLKHYGCDLFSAIEPGHSISETAFNQMPLKPGNAIMNEIRELYERDKRKNSVVIRGVMDKSEHEVKEIFNGACSYLAVGSIQISDIAKLSPSVWSRSLGHPYKTEAVA